MGAWSAGSFGNDTALDFVDGIQSENDLLEAFKAVLDTPGDDIDADVACEAIAAADVVAACLGRPAADTPEELTARLDAFGTPSETTIKLATESVKRVSAGSELAELWEETEEEEEWKVEIDNLLTRLDLSKPYVAPVVDTKDDLGTDTPYSCYLCEVGIWKSDLVTLKFGDDFASGSIYAHRACVEKQYDAPHFNADGSPHDELMKSFKKHVLGQS